jgi:hypothetical protein
VTRDTSSLVLNTTVNSLIDAVVKKGLLSKTGWIPKLLIPLFLKNYTSHYIADHKDKWSQKLFAWIGPKNHNGKAAPEKPSKN